MVMAEYRTWTDVQGNTIEAEYKGISNGKVVLVGQDGKEVEVDPAILSDEDREYIYLQEQADDSSTESERVSDAKGSTDNTRVSGLNTRAEANTAAKKVSGATGSADTSSVAGPITGGDANTIAKKYAEALSTRDYETWKSLMLDPGGWSEGSFKYRLDNELNIQQIRLKGNHREDYGYSVRIEVLVSLRDWSGAVNELEWSYWLQILPNGKIKYDDLFVEHPIKIAMDWCYAHFMDEMKIWYGGLRRSDGELENTGVSNFGATSRHTDHFTKMKALKNMRDWLLDEGRDYDITEPKVSCPDTVFKDRRRGLKGF